MIKLREKKVEREHFYMPTYEVIVFWQLRKKE